MTSTYDQPSWYGFPGMEKYQIDETWAHADTHPSFWQNLAPLADWRTFKGIGDASKNNEVYFCTSRRGVQPKLQTEVWLRGFGIINPTVIVTKRKGEFCKTIGADYAIDDKASNASFIDWQTDGKTKSYLLTRPYNANITPEFLASGVVRAASVNEFLEVIK